MLESFAFAYMQRATVAGVLVGALCAIIGVYVVLKGLAFIGAGIAHASFGGVAIGVLLGINPIWSAIVFCILTAWGIGLTSRRSYVKEDTAVGVFFASTMALGILLIGLKQGYQVDLFSYLFGSILAVTTQDVWTTVVITCVVLTTVLVLYKDLLFITFDSEMAEVTGVPAGRLYFLLITMMALTVVMSIKVVGIVLVSALIVTPAAAAYQLTEKFRNLMILAVAFGVGSCVVGLMLSDLLGIASGATIVLLSTVIFFLCAAISPQRRRSRPVTEEK
ncbi:MAG: metal ABC transporter permease [Armatimonadetes bacterium]|nr:metal ABC transporter permease [Armatimonadota bacterium]